MPREVNPCYGCEERDGGCHAKCECYALWQENRNGEYERRRLEMTTRWDVAAVKDSAIGKLRKRDGKKFGGQF